MSFKTQIAQHAIDGETRHHPVHSETECAHANAFQFIGKETYRYERHFGAVGHFYMAPVCGPAIRKCEAMTATIYYSCTAPKWSAMHHSYALS